MIHELHLQHKTKANPEKGRRAFLMLAVLFAAQIGVYGFMVNASVSHVVARMALEKQTSELSSRVSSLESSYFALQNKVTIDTATSMHYGMATRVQYVDGNGAPVVMLSRGN